MVFVDARYPGFVETVTDCAARRECAPNLEIIRAALGQQLSDSWRPDRDPRRLW